MLLPHLGTEQPNSGGVPVRLFLFNTKEDERKKLSFSHRNIQTDPRCLGHGQGPTAGAASEVSQEPHWEGSTWEGS